MRTVGAKPLERAGFDEMPEESDTPEVSAVVFDMDGVLVESERYWTEEMHDIIEAAYPPDADVTPADLTGVSIYDQYDTFGAEYEMRVDRDAYFELYDDVAESIYLERADVTDGAADLVRELKRAGLPVGLGRHPVARPLRQRRAGERPCLREGTSHLRGPRAT